LLEARQKVLKKNDLLARELRRRFEDAGVTVISLASSPGAGKTTLLARTLRHFIEAGTRVAALVGDLATDHDARRLRESGAKVQQITTGTVCHLDAEMIESAIRSWPLDTLDYLFIENVGNLVCPATFDLGESRRAVLFSTTEGEDKPAKYPPIFHTADVAVITKIDLAAAVGFDRAAALAAISSICPVMPVIEVSASSGEGFPTWCRWLHACRTLQLRL
jgi:hydrogenase nickel incorporation protein HypB